MLAPMSSGEQEIVDAFTSTQIVVRLPYLHVRMLPALPARLRHSLEGYTLVGTLQVLAQVQATSGPSCAASTQPWPTLELGVEMVLYTLSMALTRR